MALSQSALSELLDAIRAAGSADVMREAMILVLQQLIELEADQAIGAARYERTDERTTHRNGSRGRVLSTKAGDGELRIPKLRSVAFFPALLEPRRRIDRALWAVVMEAYVHGVSTRKVDDLVAALGIDTGISKSEVSRICAEHDCVVASFRDRPLGHTAFPYVFLDATYVKAHDGASVVSKAIVIATGVTKSGVREFLGLAVGDSEDGAFFPGDLTRSIRSMRRLPERAADISQLSSMRRGRIVASGLISLFSSVPGRAIVGGPPTLSTGAPQMRQMSRSSAVCASIAVIGCGHVGLVQAAGLASLGHRVVGIDRDPARVGQLTRGEVPFQEPGLYELVRDGLGSGRLCFTTRYAFAAAAEIVFVCVDTPPSASGAPDITNLRSAVGSLLETLDHPTTIIVNKSTAPIGTAELIESLVAAAGRRARVVANPEFLRQAHAVEDFFHPARIVIGARRAAERHAIARLYARIGGERVLTDLRAAELIKYAANAFLATRISFVNELARLADAVGVQIDGVVEGMAADGRIGAHCFTPGIGFGGSCLPKDTAALRHLGRSLGLRMPLLSAVLEANREARDGAVEALRRALDGLDGRTIAVWGLTFKGGTEDTRESPAVDIVRILQEEGATIRAFDPSEILRLPGNLREALAGSPLDAVRGADGLAILSDWPEFRRVPFASVRKAMTGDVVFDGRNVLSASEVVRHGLRYVGVGRPESLARASAREVVPMTVGRAGLPSPAERAARPRPVPA